MNWAWIVSEVIQNIKGSDLVDETVAVRYPGQREVEVYRENMLRGIPVDEDIWNKVLAL